MGGLLEQASSVPKQAIATTNRRILGAIPHPDDRLLLEKLRRYEPRGFRGQPPVLWDRAEGVHVFDRHGNQWLDFTSGIVVANAGHAAPAAIQAIEETASRPLHHTYCFPNAERAELVEYLIERCAPAGLDKVVLLTTGSEAVECALKIARNFAHHESGREKNLIVSFAESFHGRTMGSQMAGGIPVLKDWIVNPDPHMINAPSPDPHEDGEEAFGRFEQALDEQQADPRRIAAVVMETYPGWKAKLYPKDYVRRLRDFCDRNEALLIFDEIQAGFGRCGKMWGFEHYGVQADLIACGKGISSGLPVAAVIGRSDWMDLFGAGTLTSTHAGNPICCAAALANLRTIVEGGLIENTVRLAPVLAQALNRIQERHPDRVRQTASVGLVGVIEFARNGSEPDSELASSVVQNAVQQGLLLIAPGGAGAATVKVCPPLGVTEEQLLEGLGVLETVIDRLLLQGNAVVR